MNRPASSPAASPDPADSWSADGAALLLAMAVLIVHASLFPFDYNSGLHAQGAVAHLLGTWTDWDRPRDLTANILLYGPLGFLAVYAQPQHRRVAARVTAAALLGVGMAMCVELTQFHEPVRVSTLGDVYADAIGATLGGTAAAMFGRRVRWLLGQDFRAHRDAALLLACFLGYRLYPYVPTESLGKFRATLVGLLHAPRLSPGDMIGAAIAWLLVAAALDALYGRRRWWLLFPLFVLLEFGGHVVVVWSVLQWTDIAGALLAGVAWAALPSGRGRDILVAVLFAGLLVAWQPDHDPAGVARYVLSWLRFGGTPWTILYFPPPIFWQRLFLYGGLIWTLRRCGLSLRHATAATCVLLAATGLALVHRPAEGFGLAELGLVLTIGGTFALLHCAARHAGPAGEPAPSSTRR